MPSVAELLERESATVDLEGDHLERLLQRRDRKQRNQRIRAGALAIVLALLTFAALARAFSTKERTGNELDRPQFKGTIVTYTGTPRGWGDLVARDPDTGEVRTLVDAQSIDSTFRNLIIGSAAVSADGRWVAFEVVACGGGISNEGGAGGLWVTNGVDEPRQLTKPCFEDPKAFTYNELWAWSPTGAQVVVARSDGLVLIDPATGDRTNLGKAKGDVSALSWSPNGTRIAYGAEGSVYSVGVDGGDHSLLASSLGYTYGIGNTWVGGSGIQWSPDGRQIVIQAFDTRENAASPRDTVYLVDADGSDLRELDKEGEVRGISWSPDGSKIAYASLSAGRRIQIRTVVPDGSAPSLIFESTTYHDEAAGTPVWSPDGTQIAFKRIAFDGVVHWLVADADGIGDARQIDELRYLSWRGGWYFCDCYG